MTVNKVILVGNLGRDPETKVTTGHAVVNLALATSSSFKKGDEWVKETQWHNVIFFGNTAENICKYCTKGSMLYIEGRLQTRKWADKEGNTRYSTEIVGQTVQFLVCKGSNKDEQKSQLPPLPTIEPNDDFDIDDIPF